MREFLTNSAYFGLLISIGAYALGLLIKKKTGKAFLNPLVIAAVVVIAVLLIFKIDYEAYNKSAQYLSYLLTPATVCLAVPLYREVSLLKKNIGIVAVSLAAGALASMLSILGFAALFRLTHGQFVTLLPKSITTAIGIGVSEELGGIVPITAAAIILTGVVGNVLAVGICRILRIRDPLAKGLAIGASAHAIGTAKAMEMGETEGAASSLAIVVSGVLTVIIAPIIAQLY